MRIVVQRVSGLARAVVWTTGNVSAGLSTFQGCDLVEATVDLWNSKTMTIFFKRWAYPLFSTPKAISTAEVQKRPSLTVQNFYNESPKKSKISYKHKNCQKVTWSIRMYLTPSGKYHIYFSTHLQKGEAIIFRCSCYGKILRQEKVNDCHFQKQRFIACVGFNWWCQQVKKLKFNKTFEYRMSSYQLQESSLLDICIRNPLLGCRKCENNHHFRHCIRCSRRIGLR